MRKLCIVSFVLLLVASSHRPLPGHTEKNKRTARQAAFELILHPELLGIYSALPDSASRARWESKYWSMKDPLPSSFDNPYRDEFEGRFDFAWNYYSNLVPPLCLDDRGKYYIKFGEPDDFVENISMGRAYVDNCTWAYYGLNLFIDFVKDEYYGYREVSDLSQAVHGAPLNLKAEVAAELYGERETLHQRYLSFRGTEHNAGDYFRSVTALSEEKTTALISAPEATFTFAFAQEPLDVRCRTACFREESGATRLEIYYSAPLNEMKFVRASQFPYVSHLHKRLSLFTEEYEPLFHKREEILLPASSEPDIGSRLYVNQHNEIVPPAIYNMALELENIEGNRLAVLKLQVRAKDFTGDSLALSDLQFSSHIEEGGGGKNAKPGDILVVPYVSYGIRREKPIYIYFEIYNLSLDSNGQSEYRIEYVIRSLERQQNDILNSLLKIVNFKRSDRQAASVGTSFASSGDSRSEGRYFLMDMGNCPVGETELEVTVRDAHSEQVASARVMFTLQ